LNRGKIDEARTLSRRALDLAISARLPRGRCHYILARACAMTSSANPRWIDEAAAQLQHAFIAKADYYKPLYESDTAFDAARTRIDLNIALKSLSTNSILGKAQE
jgi:hypothetical protein